MHYYAICVIRSHAKITRKSPDPFLGGCMLGSGNETKFVLPLDCSPHSVHALSMRRRQTFKCFPPACTHIKMHTKRGRPETEAIR